MGMSGGGDARASTPPVGVDASGMPQSGKAGGAGGTAFTKIVYTKVPGETPKSVEVAGSWSKFKQRNAMTRNAAGDFEIIMELPKGQHEIKFVLDSGRWVCHPDLESRKDSQGNQNNVILVDNVARPTTKVGTPGDVGRVPSEVFVPQKSSIDIARDVVNRLEQEKKTAQEKLAKAHQQLVEVSTAGHGWGSRARRLSLGVHAS